MDCPFCGKEMKEGRVSSGDRLMWRDKEFADTIVLSGYFSPRTEAFFCPGCRQVVIPVPEIEDVWDKVQRKMDEASEKLGAVQVKWKEQREETKKQKKKEKFGQKDPWEL